MNSTAANPVIVLLRQRRGMLTLAMLFPLAAVTTWLSLRPPPGVPVDAVSTHQNWADESSCIDCHEQAEHYFSTGHAQTLRPAADPSSLERLQQVAAAEELAGEQTSIRFTNGGVYASTRVGERLNEVPLDWCFGSGQHACTWTSTMPDSSSATDQLEFRWTWYHGGVIDVTPGQPQQPTPGYFGKLGVLHDGPKAMRCFSCHADYLPDDSGRIDEGRIQPGISCQRCHGPRQAHVASDGELTPSGWRARDRMDAVHRCAQCHRRAEELPPEAIDPHDESIVRFQPVGLVQSKCFTQSEMTCTTCHDPHLPMAAQDSRGLWQCVQCHNPQRSEHVLCAAGEDDRCLECHMPAVRMEAPIAFTDHWIRVRDGSSPHAVAPQP